MFNLHEIILIIAALTLISVPVIKWALTTILDELAHFQLFKNTQTHP